MVFNCCYCVGCEVRKQNLVDGSEGGELIDSVKDMAI
jgi:hypothetical protein